MKIHTWIIQTDSIFSDMLWCMLTFWLMHDFYNNVQTSAWFLRRRSELHISTTTFRITHDFEETRISSNHILYMASLLWGKGVNRRVRTWPVVALFFFQTARRTSLLWRHWQRFPGILHWASPSRRQGIQKWWEQWFISCEAPIKLMMGRRGLGWNFLEQQMARLIPFCYIFVHHSMELLDLIRNCCRVYFIPVEYWVTVWFHSGKWSDRPAFVFSYTSATDWFDWLTWSDCLQIFNCD